MPHEFEIESDEKGFVLRVRTTWGDLHHFTIADPEALYDTVKREIGPWLYERDMAKQTLDLGIVHPEDSVPEGTVHPDTPPFRVQNPEFRCDPDESGGYAADDPKHPDYHSVHADIYDNREKFFSQYARNNEERRAAAQLHDEAIRREAFRSTGDPGGSDCLR